MDRREELLRRLVSFERPLAPIARELRGHGWDADCEIVRVSAADVVSAIRELMSGAARSEELEEWANALEGREDLACSEAVKRVIFELANPVLEGAITAERTSALLVTLGESEGAG